MSNFSHIIFDLDGTLIDSKLGLTNSLNYMLQQMAIELDGEAVIDQLIGPPIHEGLKNILGFDTRQVELGVKLFREYYSQQGYLEAELYPGVLEMLEELQMQGKMLYVATSKTDRFAEAVLRQFELDKYLEDFQGVAGGKEHTKAGLITELMERNQIIPSENVVMIGDTIFDIVGGKANEISTLGVAYGFGNSDKILELNPDFFVEDIDELYELLV